MGKDKTTNTTKVEERDEEKKFNKMRMEDYSSQRGNIQDLSNMSADLYRKILQGGSLPGQLGGAYGIGQGQTQEMVNASLSDLYPQLQASGGMDSGMANQLMANTSAGVRNNNAQFNVNSIQSLLGMGGNGASNQTNSFNQSSGMIGNQLAGLRGGRTTTLARNPFLKSFEQSAGQSMGENFSNSKNAAAAMAMFCWVASEIFGGWNHPKTNMARLYVNEIAPKWFKKLYIKHGEAIAKFISDKPVLKFILRPLFELFSLIGENHATTTRTRPC